MAVLFSSKLGSLAYLKGLYQDAQVVHADSQDKKRDNFNDDQCCGYPDVGKETK